MKYFIASFLLTGVLHGWLIIRQWGSNPATLSYHAVKSRLYYVLYVAGHLLNAILLWLFMNAFFGTPGLHGLVLILAVIAVTTEILQALIPSKGKLDAPHTFFAVMMASSMYLIGLVCTFLFAPNVFVLWINIIASIIVGGFFLKIKYPPKLGLWKLQYLGQLILYVQIYFVVHR